MKIYSCVISLQELAPQHSLLCVLLTMHLASFSRFDGWFVLPLAISKNTTFCSRLINYFQLPFSPRRAKSVCQRSCFNLSKVLTSHTRVAQNFYSDNFALKLVSYFSEASVERVHLDILRVYGNIDLEVCILDYILLTKFSSRSINSLGQFRVYHHWARVRFPCGT